MSETAGFELGTDGPTAILVGVDDSVTSRRALSYAVGLARRQRVRLVVAYVMGGPSIGAMAPGVLAAEMEAQEEVAAGLRTLIEQVTEELGISATFVTAHGDPYAEIKRAADDTRADAIVVGASAQAGHRFVGSLAVRLVRAGRWPVTVVP